MSTTNFPITEIVVQTDYCHTIVSISLLLMYGVCAILFSIWLRASMSHLGFNSFRSRARREEMVIYAFGLIGESSLLILSIHHSYRLLLDRPCQDQLEKVTMITTGLAFLSIISYIALCSFIIPGVKDLPQPLITFFSVLTAIKMVQFCHILGMGWYADSLMEIRRHMLTAVGISMVIPIVLLSTPRFGRWAYKREQDMQADTELVEMSASPIILPVSSASTIFLNPLDSYSGAYSPPEASGDVTPSSAPPSYETVVAGDRLSRAATGAATGAANGPPIVMGG